jgi:AcrR family transcriptional regulator
MTEIEISRRDRKKEETRQRVFKVAMRLFRERGFEATTVDEITEKADVAKGTFFFHFPRKEAVLAYFSQLRLEEVQADAERILAEPQSARQKLLEVFAHAATSWEEDRELSRYVLMELVKLMFGPARETGEGWEALLVRMVEQGRSNGEFRADVDPIRVTATLGGIYYALLFDWTSGCTQNPDLRAELRARLSLVLDGIAAGRAGA